MLIEDSFYVSFSKNVEKIFSVQSDKPEGRVRGLF